MANDYLATTTEAASRLYEATREASVAVWAAGIEGQERYIKLAKTWIDESKSQSTLNTGLLETLKANARKGQEAGQELAQTSLAAGLATLYFPLAVADQMVRPVVGR